MERHDSLETWKSICQNSRGIALAARAASTGGTNQSTSTKPVTHLPTAAAHAMAARFMLPQFTPSHLMGSAFWLFLLAHFNPTGYLDVLWDPWLPHTLAN